MIPFLQAIIFDNRGKGQKLSFVLKYNVRLLKVLRQGNKDVKYVFIKLYPILSTIILNV